MSGLREAFDEIVADVPVYGDLELAIEQAERERRHRYVVIGGLAAAAAVVAVIVGLLAITHPGNGSEEPVGPTTPTPTPTQAKTQSPQTWVDTRATATHAGPDWDVPDPLDAARDAWSQVVTEYLDPPGDQLQHLESSPFGVEFELPSDGSLYSYPTLGRIGLVVDGAELNPFDGCRYLTDGPGGPAPSSGTESCSEERLAGPHGEPARISRYERLCGAFDGPAAQYATCGDYRVAVAVNRGDGLIGFVVVDGRGSPEINPLSPAAMAAVAGDPRLALPDTAYAVPPDRDVASVVADHFPGYRFDPSSALDHTGYAQVYGRVARLGLSATVRPAGGNPACGRLWLIDCVARRVFGADDPTTVWVGEWEEEDWADCCPRNSRAWRRGFVYVGPRHTVAVWESRVVPADEESPGAELDQRVIDLVLDSRLQ